MLDDDLSVEVSDSKESSTWIRPIGAIHVPNSQVYLLTAQNGYGPGLGLFGVVGVLAVDAANRNNATQVLGSAADALQIDIVPDVRSLLERAAQQHGKRMQMTSIPEAEYSKGRGLRIEPFVVLQRAADDAFRPYVVLRAAKGGETAVDRWKEDFVVPVEVARPLNGPDGWSSSDGSRLRASIQAALEIATNALVVEITKGLPRNGLKSADANMQVLGLIAPMDTRVSFVEDYQGRVLANVHNWEGSRMGTYLVPASMVTLKNIKPLE